MKTKELANKVFERMKSFNPNEVMPKLKLANEGAIADYMNTKTCMNYQWMCCLVDVVKPRQIVELGGAMGVGTICLGHYLPKTSHFYSITLEEGGLEFSYIPLGKEPKNWHLIVGNDLDMKNWQGVDLSATDIWYFDTEHSFEQLGKELDLFTAYFKKDTILLFDDIRINELWSVWRKLPYDKVELTKPLHWSGFGLAIV